MSLRIRGAEVTLQVIVDGVLQVGSFAKLESFKLTPRTDLVESDFLGEKESEIDLMHHGFDFSFVIHEMEAKAIDLLNTIVAREEQGLPHPEINIAAVHNYRDTGTPSKTIVMESCRLKLDDHEFSGRKDYVKNSFSGKAKTTSTF